MYPYNHKRGQTIQSDASNYAPDRAFLAHYAIAAADAAAEANAAVMALVVLGTAAASVTAGFTNPAVPRNVKAVANVAGVTTKVKVYGTNFADEAINEEITLNGTTAVAGSLAFKTITKVDLPARTHTPAKQKATITPGGGAAGAGDEVFTFISAITGAAFDITIAFAAEDDDATKAAAKIIAGLNADEAFAAHWLAAAGAGAALTIESLTYEAQDATINLTVKTAGTPNVSLGSITVNTVAGVVEDKVSVGIGKKFGIPYMLTAAELVILKLFNNAADTGTVTADADELEKNVIALNGTPDAAKPIDLYIIV
jgi:hypothetical protein